jgi:hypothetical protein
VFFDLIASLSLYRLGVEDADNAVGIAHRRHFGVCHNDGFVRKAHGKRGTALDASWAVAEDPIKHLFERADHAQNTLLGKSILVAGLRGGKEREFVEPLVADKRLRKLGHTLCYVDKIVDHPSFRAHHKVEVSQAYVEIDYDDILSKLRERRA